MMTTTIIKKEKISHNTWIITLDLEKEIEYEDSYFFTYIYDEGGKRKKPYTPVLFDITQLTFLIKHYNCEGVADYIVSRDIGETLNLSMPVYKTERKPHTKENVLLLAGGTGISPMLQIMNYSHANVKFTVIFSNSTTRDIIINEDIMKYRANIRIYNVISRKDDEDIVLNSINPLSEHKSCLMYSRVSSELINQITKENDIDLFDFVYCCGPVGYMNDVCGNKNKDKSQGKLFGFLKELGYDGEKVYKF